MKVRYFSKMQESTGKEEEIIEKELSLDELIKLIEKKYKIKFEKDNFSVLIDGRREDTFQKINKNSVVSFIPIIEGG